MIKKAALVAAFAGIAALVSPIAGHAQPENAGNVQLNADTAVLHGLKGTYQGDGSDFALGGCVAAGTDGLSAPKTARFTSPVLTVYPGVLILLTVLAFNTLGDGLRDALDPESATGQ